MAKPKTQEEWTEQIQRDISGNQVFIYAKGEKNAPECGFSHRAMEVFNKLGVDYQVRNILSDPLLEDALCAVTRWETTPQIFVGGEFIGGSDIVTEMYESGELKTLIEQTRSAAS